MKQISLAISILLTLSIGSCSSEDNQDVKKHVNFETKKFSGVTSDTITVHAQLSQNQKFEKPMEFRIYKDSIVSYSFKNSSDTIKKTYINTGEKTEKSHLGSMSTFLLKEPIVFNNLPSAYYYIYFYKRNDHFILHYANVLYKGTIVHIENFHNDSCYIKN